MTTDAVVEIANKALLLIIKVSLPILLVSLIIGLLISIFQAVTSIQEQTLTFVPKIICVFLALIVFGQWMLTSMVEFSTELSLLFQLESGIKSIKQMYYVDFQ